MISRLPSGKNEITLIPFALSGEWDSALLRIQLSLEGVTIFDRADAAVALNMFTKALKEEFCEHTKKKSTAPLGDKFNLDYFHVCERKIDKETGASLIEVFKKKHLSSEQKQEEMGRKKLQRKIRTVENIIVTLAGGEHEDILSEHLRKCFLEYVIILQKLVTPESTQTLIDVKNILETEKSISIKRGTLMGFLTLTQHQFGGQQKKSKKIKKT